MRFLLLLLLLQSLASSVLCLGKLIVGINKYSHDAAICIVDEGGKIKAQKKVATCPVAIEAYLARHAPDLGSGRYGDRPSGSLALE